MGRLRPNWTVQAVIPAAQTSVGVSIAHNGYETLWVVEQIAVSYNKAGDTPTVSLQLDGNLYAGPAQMIPISSGLGQTFGGQPYLYLESDDNLQVLIQGGTAGAGITVQVQYRQISYGHDELQGRF